MKQKRAIIVIRKSLIRKKDNKYLLQEEVVGGKSKNTGVMIKTK